jgi:hypothetical protein
MTGISMHVAMTSDFSVAWQFSQSETDQTLFLAETEREVRQDTALEFLTRVAIVLVLFGVVPELLKPKGRWMGTSQVCHIFSWYNIPKRVKCIKLPQNKPNGHKIYQKPYVKYMYQHIPFQDPPQFTQIGTLVENMYIYHQATLEQVGCCWPRRWLALKKLGPALIFIF